MELPWILTVQALCAFSWGGGGGGVGVGGWAGERKGDRACSQFLKRLVAVYQILVYLLFGQI